jgi:hypothetical protein
MSATTRAHRALTAVALFLSLGTLPACRTDSDSGMGPTPPLPGPGECPPPDRSAGTAATAGVVHRAVQGAVYAHDPRECTRW